MHYGRIVEKNIKNILSNPCNNTNSYKNIARLTVPHSAFMLNVYHVRALHLYAPCRGTQKPTTGSPVP
jgi:hypothetical protein